MTELVSIIITVLNGEKWIDICFNSIVKNIKCIENSPISIEICVHEDASTDETPEILESWIKKFSKYNVKLKVFKNLTGVSKGVGYGRNVAIKNSNGLYLCFQDIDDEMLPNRILEQYNLTKLNNDSIIGSKFIRSPENSTNRFQRWANNIDHNKLNIQIYTSNGPTVIMPTWFCHRNVYNKIDGGFCENGKGTPEDLIFFYKHLDLGGKILRVDKTLLIYRYHPEATTFSITEQTIWKIRLNRLIKNILQNGDWKNGFTIWNAGRQGRKFFRDLPDDIKYKVRGFCDVDKNKVNKKYEYFDEIKRKVTFSVPIIHFQNAKQPIIVCMKLDLTNGEFEKNLTSLKLIEGVDYVIFS